MRVVRPVSNDLPVQCAGATNVFGGGGGVLSGWFESAVGERRDAEGAVCGETDGDDDNDDNTPCLGGEPAGIVDPIRSSPITR